MKILSIVGLIVLLLFSTSVSASSDDEKAISLIQDFNKQLAEKGLNIAIEKIEFFTIGEGRPDVRIHQTGLRWVADDHRRLADGDKLTYLVDQSDGVTTNGLTNAQTEAAIDNAMGTWQSEKCLKKLDIVKRSDTGTDPDIFDGLMGFGGVGDPFLADIVEAGWLPKAFFEAFGGAGEGDHKTWGVGVEEAPVL